MSVELEELEEIIDTVMCNADTVNPLPISDSHKNQTMVMRKGIRNESNAAK